MAATITKIAAAAAVLFSAGISDAHAQNCRDLPQGQSRWQCAVKRHPHLAVVRQKCYDEAKAMGLGATMGEGHQNKPGVGVGGIADYTRGCIHRTIAAHHGSH